MSHVGMKRVAAVLTASLALVAAAGTAPASAAVVPGTLVVGTTLGIASLDPHKLAYPAQSFFTNLLYDRLTDVDKNGKVVPMLATSWKIVLNPTGSTILLNLRRNLKFADGTPFTADSVVASFNRAQKLTGSTAAQYFVGVQTKKISPYVVSLYRNIQYGGVTNMPGTLAGGAASIISQNAIAANQDLTSSSAGIGMFQVTSSQLGKFVGAASSGYWDTNAQKLKTITINTLPLPDARANAVRSEAVLLANVPPTLTASLASGSVSIEKGKNANSVIAFSFANRGTLSDARVRQALSMSLDRPAICTAIFYGACDAAYQPFSVHSPFFKAGAKNEFGQFNLDKAKALVDAAGATGKTVVLGAPSDAPQYTAIATVLQANAKKIGLDVKVVGFPSTQLVAKFQNKEVDGIIGQLGPLYDPADIYARYFTNNTLPTDPPVDAAVVKLYEASNKATSAAVRQRLYQQMSELQEKTMASAPVLNENFYWAVNNAVKGFVGPSALGLFSVRGVSVS